MRINHSEDQQDPRNYCNYSHKIAFFQNPWSFLLSEETRVSSKPCHFLKRSKLHSNQSTVLTFKRWKVPSVLAKRSNCGPNKLSTPRLEKVTKWIHPGKINMEPEKIHPWKRKIVFQTSCSGSMLIFGGVCAGQILAFGRVWGLFWAICLLVTNLSSDSSDIMMHHLTKDQKLRILKHKKNTSF